MIQDCIPYFARAGKKIGLSEVLYMIDFHTHILPGIDDGSQSLEESRRLLEESFLQGTGQLAATPHFYADDTSFERFLTRREESITKLLHAREGFAETPMLCVGAEVYYFPGISRAERIPELCIRGTKLLLLEMPFAQWSEEMYREVKALLEKRKIQVILAHIERYYNYQKDRSVWQNMWKLPVYPQINAGSFLKRGRKKFCLDFIKKQGHILLGSDCHNMEHRPPNLFAGRQVIEKKLGVSFLEEIDAFSAELLQDAEIL